MDRTKPSKVKKQLLLVPTDAPPNLSSTPETTPVSWEPSPLIIPLTSRVACWLCTANTDSIVGDINCQSIVSVARLAKFTAFDIAMRHYSVLFVIYQTKYPLNEITTLSLCDSLTSV